jgi:hypothetical protein
MMDFDLIWPRFCWVLDDMRNGMAFFEGYVPILGETDLLGPLRKLIKRAENHTFRTSIWSSEATASDWDKEYSDDDYVAFFESGRIYTLHFDYEVRVGNTPLFLKLLFDRDKREVGKEPEVALEIVCYRETILAAPDTKRAIFDAVSELCTLKQLFHGDALFLGPDTFERPASRTSYSKDWLRIE